MADYKNADFVSKTHHQKLTKNKRTVELITIDDYLDKNNIEADFIKIDIEGFELFALKGMLKTLPKLRGLMVEVTENQREVWTILKEIGFDIEDERGVKLSDVPHNYNGNIFAVRPNLN